MNEFVDPFNSGVGSVFPYWHHHARRISKHRKGWTTKYLNDQHVRRWKALERRRATRKANR